MMDKSGVLARHDLRDVVIELGCGAVRRRAGSIGVDVIDGENVDIVGDALEVLRALPEGCARLVTSWHFLEHVPDAGPILNEMSRLLGQGGEIEIVVPHFANPYFHSDPTHRNSLGFGLYTMSYYARDPILRRQVPGYVRCEQLTVKSVDLHFKAAPPFYGRYALKRAIGAFFNSTRYLQELWEESFCYLVPCYEIRYVLGRTADLRQEPE
jgi:ubiquinone/menaquinone biosynthesis C-methylase UbiE